MEDQAGRVEAHLLSDQELLMGQALAEGWALWVGMQDQAWLESWMRWDVQVEGRASELVGLGKGRGQPGTHLASSTAQKHSGA